MMITALFLSLLVASLTFGGGLAQHLTRASRRIDADVAFLRSIPSDMDWREDRRGQLIKTWSLESAFVRAYSTAAVAFQGLIDSARTLEQLTRPVRRDERDGDQFPLVGCPNPQDCREYGCADDCSEAVERDGAEDLSGKEAEEECSEPSNDESSAVVSRNEPAERSPEVDSIPRIPPASPRWSDLADRMVEHLPSAKAEEPDVIAAICGVLSEHAFWVANASSIGSNAHCRCGARPHGAMEWREHLAPIIAEALEPHRIYVKRGPLGEPVPVELRPEDGPHVIGISAVAGCHRCAGDLWVVDFPNGITKFICDDHGVVAHSTTQK